MPYVTCTKAIDDMPQYPGGGLIAFVPGQPQYVHSSVLHVYQGNPDFAITDEHPSISSLNAQALQLTASGLRVNGAAPSAEQAAAVRSGIGADDAENIDFTPAGPGAVPRSMQEKARDVEVSFRDFGAVGGGADDTTAIMLAFASGAKRILLKEDFCFSHITIPTNVVFSGHGALVGIQSNGTKPDISALEATANSAARLSALGLYNKNSITFTGTSALKGGLKCSNALLLASGMTTLVIHGRIDAENCSAHGINFTCKTGGSLNAPSFVSSDAPFDALRTENGGNIYAQDSIVYRSGREGAYVFFGGTIHIPNSFVWRSGRIGLHVNGGGSMHAQKASVRYSNNQSVAVEYGGSINFFQGVASDSVSSVGLVAESNGCIYAQEATIENNALWPISTSYNGFVQARNATITGNGLPVRTLTGGVIQILGATVTGNNSGGVQVHANGLGYIFAERPGTASSGKETLTASQYLPPYGVMGQGMGMIHDGESSANYPNDRVGMSLSQIYRPKAVGVVSGNTLTVSSPWVIVSTAVGAVVIDNIVLASDFSTEELHIQPDGANSLTIQTGAGNVRVASPVVAAGGLNNVIKMLKTGYIDRWTVPLN